MATARDVINSSFSKIGIKAAETPLTAAEIQDGLDVLNDLLTEWMVNSTVPSAEPVMNVDDELNVPPRSLPAIKANLSPRLASIYDREVPVTLENEAYKTLNSLLASNGKFEVKYPSTLPVGSGNYDENFLDDDFFPPDSKRNF